MLHQRDTYALGCENLPACTSLGGEVLVFDGSTYGYRRGYDLAASAEVSEVVGTIPREHRDLLGAMRVNRQRVLLSALDTAAKSHRSRGKVVVGSELA